MADYKYIPDCLTRGLGVMLLGLGLSAQFSPVGGAKTFAGTIITNDDRALMFPIVGGRNAGFGLALLAFSLQGQRKAAATLMLCNMVGGIVDVMWCLKHGSEKWIGHAIGSALGAPLVWWLWQ